MKRHYSIMDLNFPNKAGNVPGASADLLMKFIVLIDTDSVLDTTRYIKRRFESDNIDQTLKNEMSHIIDRWTKLSGYFADKAEEMASLLTECNKNCSCNSAQFRTNIDKIENILGEMYSSTYQEIYKKIVNVHE
jgi:hypothetical protein